MTQAQAQLLFANIDCIQEDHSSSYVLINLSLDNRNHDVIRYL
jgi:hypothetical protein